MLGTSGKKKTMGVAISNEYEKKHRSTMISINKNNNENNDVVLVGTSREFREPA